MMRSLLLIALSVPLVKAQQVGPQPCRADPSVVGYSSIAQLNRDMLVEQQRIADGGTPQDSYLFTLCPFTDFDVTSGPLLPLLDNSMFLCGASGDVGDECTLTGGTAQVRIQDSTVPGFPLATVSFTGLTFSGFTTNAAGTGASIQAVASTTTTATFTDVRWQDFSSNLVVRQTSSSGIGMNINVAESFVSNGQAGAVFDNDGGFLNIDDLTVSELTGGSLVATANSGISFLQDSSISGSSLGSVTFTTSSGAQSVTRVLVRGMASLDDGFLVQGTGSTLTVSRSSVRGNDLDSTNIFNASGGASARILDTSIIGNSGVEFGVIASGQGTSVEFLDSFANNNVGAATSIGATVFAISGASVDVQRSEFARNTGISGEILAFLGSTVNVEFSCFSDGDATFVAFEDNRSTITQANNFVDDYNSSFCPEPGPRLFQEAANAGCFTGGECDGACLVFNDQEVCQAQAAPTASPTLTPTGTPTLAPVIVPTSSPTVAPTGRPTTAAPTVSPTVTPTATPTTTPKPTGDSPRPSIAPTVFLEPSSAPSAADTSAPTIVGGSQAPSLADTLAPTRAPVDNTQKPNVNCIWVRKDAPGSSKGKGKGKGSSSSGGGYWWDSRAWILDEAAVEAEDDVVYYLYCPPTPAPSGAPQHQITQAPVYAGKGIVIPDGKGGKGKGGKGKSGSKKKSKKSHKSPKSHKSSKKGKKDKKSMKKRRLNQDEHRPVIRRPSPS